MNRQYEICLTCKERVGCKLRLKKHMSPPRQIKIMILKCDDYSYSKTPQPEKVKE